ncbi:hypothetical protein AB4Z39_13860 [Mycobacterium adipatum]|uniref:hypothetical protein n=1 Tax=Mycobacterium adipatum TaxID=1682113 RepID=UPI0034E0CB50
MKREDLHNQGLDLDVLVGGPPLQHAHGAGELVPGGVLVGHRGDEVLGIGVDPLFGECLWDQELSVAPQRGHRIDGEGIGIVRVVQKALDSVVAPAGQADFLGMGAIGGSEQSVDVLAGVVQGVFGRGAGLTPVRMVATVEDDDDVDVADGIFLGAPRQRSGGDDLLDVRQRAERLPEQVPACAGLTYCVDVGVDHALERFEGVIHAHVFSWLSPFDLLFQIYLGAPTHQRRSACPSPCVALFTAIRAAALPHAFFPVVPSVVVGEGFRRRRRRCR